MRYLPSDFMTVEEEAQAEADDCRAQMAEDEPILAHPIPEAPRTSCALCGGEGRCYTVDGLAGGYIDACHEHAERVARDALEGERP